MKKSDVVSKALENWRKGIHAKCGICACLNDTQVDLIGMWRNPYDWYYVISVMIGKHSYVNSWLSERGIYPTESELREYRELWLEHLLNFYLEQGE